MNIYLLSEEVIAATKEMSALARQKGVIAPTILFAAPKETGNLGYYDPNQNMIVISEELLGKGAEEMRTNVFLHELAHYVDYLRNHTSAHDKTFREICNELGVDPDYSYAVVRDFLAKKQKMQQKVEKLVALSSSDFEGEADSAINKAKALMEKYSLEYTSEGEKDEIYGVDVLKTGNIKTWVKSLKNIISDLTGAFNLTQHAKKNTISFFGSREQCEFALYLWEHFTFHIEEKYKQIKAKSYYRIHPADTHNGIVAGIKAKVGESSKALILSQAKNEEIYKRVTGCRIRHSSYHIGCGSQYSAGRAAGEGISIPKSCTGMVKRIAGY